MMTQSAARTCPHCSSFLSAPSPCVREVAVGFTAAQMYLRPRPRAAGPALDPQREWDEQGRAVFAGFEQPVSAAYRLLNDHPL